MALFDWRARLRARRGDSGASAGARRPSPAGRAAAAALTRYYLAAGAGGIAAGVHTTQFAIRERGLYGPVLALAAEEARGDVIRIAGVCGPRRQAVAEAECAARLGYHAALLSFAALPDADTAQLMEHAAAVGAVMPLFGFYLQPAVGGRLLGREFWRRFAALECVVAIKIAPFNRYQTLDVLHGVADSGRAGEIALYTGNDDHIVQDLTSEFRGLRMVGGLLGQWAVWTRRAVEMHCAIRGVGLPACPLAEGEPEWPEWRSLADQLTDANAALFDAANGFRGCIAGIHEVLRGQGLLQGTWCLDPAEGLSPGQAEEIARVRAAYPHLLDDDFVARHLDSWLR